MTLEEAILHAEEAASDYEGMIEDYWLDSEKLAKCANEQRQIAEWLKELAERRKQPEIIRCGECVNFVERDFCKVAGRNVHRKSNCMNVFGAKRRTE
jgi:hypothetical protein